VKVRGSGSANFPPVASVVSILDVPLLESPPVSLDDLSEGIRTLEDPGTKIQAARKELTNSPLYRNRLISPDGGTTALQVDLRPDQRYQAMLEKQSRLREKRLQGELTAAESAELVQTSRLLKERNAVRQDALQKDIALIRAELAGHQEQAELHLGGVPMIAADSIRFIRQDLIVFGTGVFCFLVVILTVAFRRLRWVLLPMLTCLATGLTMIGLLGLVGWPVTVVSANFTSLLLIITLSFSIHLIVYYRELHSLHPEAGQLTLVHDTLRDKFRPCFYTAITTMVAFGSLLLSGIRPVIDFGWMMAIGIFAALLMSFTLFPAALMFFKPGRPAGRRDLTAAITSFIAVRIERRPTAVLMGFSLLLILSVAGMTRLNVENRFIDYFKETTEIYQGMKLIDRKLGGTTPLDVIVDAPGGFFSGIRGRGGGGSLCGFRRRKRRPHHHQFLVQHF